MAKDVRVFGPSINDTPQIVAANGETHARIRRLMSHAFSDKALRSQESLMKHYINLLITRLREKCAKGEAVDIVEWLNFTTFDLIGDLAFGESFGSFDRPKL